MKAKRLLSVVWTAMLPLCFMTAAPAVTVNNPDGNAIYQTLVDMGLNFRTVDSLKVTGTVSEADFKILANAMNSLAWIDLSETDITMIPDEAFKECQNLQEIILPSTFTTFGNNCFEYCRNLVKVSGYENVESVGNYSFHDTRIEKAPFGDKIVSIGVEAFWSCPINDDLVFPACFKSFGSWAFENTQIKSVDLSKAPVDIASCCFYNCYKLEKVVLSETGSYQIYERAFYQDTLVKEIFIPACVTQIGDKAFGYENNIKISRTVTMQSKTPIAANANSFGDSFNENLTLNVPAGTKFDYLISKGYSVFNTINESGYAISIEGKGTVSVGNHNYADGSVCFPDNDADTQFTIVPAVGYEIVSVSFDDTPKELTGDSFTVGSDIATGSLKVKFAPKSISLSFSLGSGGQLYCNNTNMQNGTVLAVKGGESFGIEIIPNNGYFIKSLQLNGVDYTVFDGNMEFNTPALSDNTTIAVEFGSSQDLADYVKVAVSQKGYGTILLNGNPVSTDSYMLIKKDADVSFKFIPGTDGSVQSLIVNEVDLTSSIADNTISLGNQTQDINLEVQFFSVVDVMIENPDGKLRAKFIDQGITTKKVKNLKLTGNIEESDFAMISAMTNLETLDLSETSITEIPEGAFKSMSSLVSVSFPLSLMSIRDQAFNECRNLRYVSGYENIRYLYYRAFGSCQSLEVLPFGDKIERIYGYVFDGCNNIPKDIVLPPSLKSMDSRPFGYSDLHSIDLSQCKIDGGFGWHAFEQFKYVVLPETGNYSIWGQAFGDSKITSLIIPEAVTQVSDQIFQDARYLRDVYMRSALPPTTNSDPFGGNYTTMTLHVPAGSLEEYSNTAHWCNFGKIVEYGIGLKADNGGEIYVNGKLLSGESTVFPDGDEIKVNLVPNLGFDVASVTLNGNPVAVTDNSFTISSSVETGSLQVSFAVKSLSVTVAKNNGGTLTYNGNIIENGTSLTVNGGESLKFAFTPDEGCFVKSIKFNNVDYPVFESTLDFSTPVLSDNSSLEIVFGTPQEYVDFIKVNVNQKGYGSVFYKGSAVTPGVSVLVQRGSSPEFSFVPGTAGYVKALLVNSFDMISDMTENAVTLSNLSQDVNMQVTFFSTVDVWVDNPNGKLKEILAEDKIKTAKIKNIKLTGNVSEQDFVMLSSMANIETVDLSETNITEIPSETFRSKKSLVSIAFPLSLVSVRDQAFYECRNLKNITGYDNIRYLYYNAFAYCESLEVLPFGDKIERIYDYVFDGCSNIPKDIVMCPSLKSMNNRPFGYSNLNSIDLSHCTFDGSLSWHAFEKFKYVLLPNNGNYSLWGQVFGDSKISSLIIPAAVTQVGSQIFQDANNLKDVYMRSAVPPTTDSDPFGGNYTLMTLHVPVGSLDDYSSTPHWCNFGNIVEYGIGVETDENRGVIYANGARITSESGIFPDGNSDITISLVPNPGYELDQVLFDGTLIAAQSNGTYSIAADVNDGTLTVKWKAKKYGITVNYSGTGVVVCAGRTLASGDVLMVDTASVVQFEMAPVNGYLVKNISFNGVETVVQNGGKIYVTPAISGTSTLDVAFAESAGLDGVYEFNVSTGNNGSIVYKHTTLLQETSINIAAGDKAVFEINPKNNYKLAQILYNATDVTNSVVNGQFVIASVSEAATMKISFDVKTDIVVPLTMSGTLGTAMFDELKAKVEQLKVTGPMNSTDFDVIRNELPSLKSLDLSGAEFTYVPDQALYTDSVVRHLTYVKLPATVDYINCDAFKGCTIDTLVINTPYSFGSCWNAFDNTVLYNTIVIVPEGLEGDFKNCYPWDRFKNITDGIINRNGDLFCVDGTQFAVTDIIRMKVQAIISHVSEYAEIPSTITVGDQTFTVDGAKFSNTDYNGDRYILTNMDFGPWKGKYLYSSEYRGNVWVGAPDEKWITPDFDDSEWTEFDGPISTSGDYTQWKGERDCYWVRRTFQLDEIDFKSLRLFYSIWEPMTVYVNGIKVVENNSYYDRDIPASYFRVGTNVVAAYLEHGTDYERMDFSLRQKDYLIDGMIYSITNDTRKEMALIGANTDIVELNVPSTVTLLGNTYSVTSIAESAFRSEGDARSFSKITFPSTLTYLDCDAFRGCQIDTIVLTSTTTFGGCWNAFDDNTKQNTVLMVPIDMEDQYKQHNPWNYFVHVTDGVVNRNNETFESGNLSYIVTDIDNKIVQAIISSISQYDLLPETVTVNNMTFTVNGAKLDNLDSNGNRYLLTNREFGSWKAKYMYSAEFKDSTWVGAPDDNWTKPDYDDSNWGVIYGPVTYGYGYTEWKGNNDCYWVRRTFQLDKIDFKSLYLQYETWGSPMTVYINGVLFRENSYSYENVPASYFKVGTNVVAISIERNDNSVMMDFSLQQREYAIDGLLYSITNNTKKEVALNGVLTGNKEITVPATVTMLGTTYKVTSIASLGSSKEVTKVLGMKNVERIEDWSFANCTSLNEVAMPDGLKYIGRYAFYNCPKLNQDIVISESATIEEWAFHYSGIKSVTINSASVGNYAFNNCSALEKVVLNEGVVRIGYESFRDCRNLNKVILGNGLTSIGENAFCYSAIDSLIIPSSVTTIGNSAFNECRNLVYVQLPDNLTTIESYAFYGCRGIASLTIPASVTSIGVNALYGIGFVRMESSNPPVLSSEDQFEEITAILLPNGAYDTYCNAAYWTNYQKQFTTADNMERVAVVSQNPTCSNLEEVLGAENLPYIVGLKVIGTINSYDIFMLRNKMTLLRKLDLSEATIVANDFEYYEGYHSEDNVIGPYSFSENNINTIILPANAIKIGGSAFQQCRYLTQIVIPDAVETIEWSAFANCEMLRSVYVGNGVKSIESSAFYWCNNLRELHLGKNVTAIGSNAFYWCENLRLIEFGPRLQMISDYAFGYCRNLTDIILPSNLVQISWGAFNGCTSLKEIKIPSSVKYIYDYAFYECPLEKVYTYTIEPTKISQHTFSASAYKTSRLYIPSTSKRNYYNNTQWGQFTGGFVDFDEPYDFFYLNGDYELTSTTGRIDGTPDMEMNYGSGISVEGNDVQTISAIELGYNAVTGEGAAIIAGSGETNTDVVNLTAQSMNVNIGVEGNRWYFFCFPFDLSTDSIECTSDYVFYSYDGQKRAKGFTGWTKLDASVTTLEKGTGYIFQSSYTGMLTIHVDKDYLQFTGKSESEVLESFQSNDESDASWNFLGNPFISYYDVNDLAAEYDAPIVVWNGYSYEVYKPGDDDYQLKPFEAFFVQKSGNKNAIEFMPENRLTYNQSKTTQTMHANRRAADAGKINPERMLVNITLMNSDSITDRTRIVFSSKASKDYEIGVDATKFHTDGVPQIYSMNGTVKYAINERPQSGEDIRLGYVAPKAGVYTLSLPRMDADVELYDNQTNSVVMFMDGVYEFTTQAGTFNDRFVIRKSGGVTAVENGFSLDGLTVVTVDGGIDIEGSMNGKVSVYTESGMLIAEPVETGRVELTDGVYIIKIGERSIKMCVE